MFLSLRWLASVGLAFLLFFAPSVHAASDEPEPERVELPSAQPSGQARNDRIVLAVFLPRGVTSTRRVPAVVLLPYLGAVAAAPEFRRLARFLSGRGVFAVVMTLPFHGERAVGDAPVNHYVNDDVPSVVTSWNQAASDVSTVVTWLQSQPDVDPTRIAGAGASLGALVLHLTMGRDARLGAGVALLGGGDLSLIFRHSLLTRFRLRRRGSQLSPDEEKQLRQVDPITFASFNRPRKVLMIEGARDFIIPPSSAQRLWEALGRPPIIWTATNHVALQFVEPEVRRVTYEFLQQAWRGDTDLRAPRLYAPTLKVGFLSGLDSNLTPALTFEALTLGHSFHHLPLVELNVGLSGRGPFASVATALTPTIDVGIARRLNGRQFRPYGSLHVAF